MVPNTALFGWIIYLFGSGLIFFIGVGCVETAVILFAVVQRSWVRRFATIAGLLGVVLCGLSAAPLAYWFYAIEGVIVSGWLIVEQNQRAERRTSRMLWRTLAALICVVGMGMELPHQFSPSIPQRDSTPLYIVADSVTAGVGEREAVTWPTLLAEEHHIEVHDFSRMGANVSSAYTQAEQLPDTGGLVLIEIGGNDLLGTTTAADYERGLERLVTRTAAAHRVVLMFELPLPPLCNEYGRIQRRLAARHGVRLIPKRIFIGVLSKPGNTLDSLHLSQAGHRQMADLVWALIGK